MLTIGIAAVVFAVIEYFCHREYHEKHPDYDRSFSGIYGYVLIAIVALYKAFI